MPQRLDETLIEQITKRDEDALEELYERYHRLVYSIALNTVGRSEDAEEITLDVFTRVWQKASTYHSEKAKVVTWLTRLARNRAIDVLRREEIRPSKHSIAWTDADAEITASEEKPEWDVQLKFQKQRVREALATLTETQREVLALAYFKGYSHSEIAEVLHLPLGTVKGRVRAGMQSLRSALESE
jgi:RNA polymerase sigma-70 factor (ECF subfamily)